MMRRERPRPKLNSGSRLILTAHARGGESGRLLFVAQQVSLLAAFFHQDPHFAVRGLEIYRETVAAEAFAGGRSD